MAETGSKYFLKTKMKRAETEIYYFENRIERAETESKDIFETRIVMAETVVSIYLRV